MILNRVRFTLNLALLLLSASAVVATELVPKDTVPYSEVPWLKKPHQKASDPQQQTLKSGQGLWWVFVLEQRDGRFSLKRFLTQPYDMQQRLFWDTVLGQIPLKTLGPTHQLTIHQGKIERSRYFANRSQEITERVREEDGALETVSTRSLPKDKIIVKVPAEDLSLTMPYTLTITNLQNGQIQSVPIPPAMRQPRDTPSEEAPSTPSSVPGLSLLWDLFAPVIAPAYATPKITKDDLLEVFPGINDTTDPWRLNIVVQYNDNPMFLGTISEEWKKYKELTGEEFWNEYGQFWAEQAALALLTDAALQSSGDWLFNFWYLPTWDSKYQDIPFVDQFLHEIVIRVGNKCNDTNTSGDVESSIGLKVVGGYINICLGRQGKTTPTPTADPETFKKVVRHEFGHAMAVGSMGLGLADEYVWALLGYGHWPNCAASEAQALAWWKGFNLVEKLYPGCATGKGLIFHPISDSLMATLQGQFKPIHKAYFCYTTFMATGKAEGSFCQSLPKKPSSPYYDAPEQCDDFEDNDGDGWIDCRDPNCFSKFGPDWYICCGQDSDCANKSAAQKPGWGACQKFDDDGMHQFFPWVVDTVYGLASGGVCSEKPCYGQCLYPDCQPGDNEATCGDGGKLTCFNRRDDDGDGQMDCLDIDCAGLFYSDVMGPLQKPLFTNNISFPGTNYLEYPHCDDDVWGWAHRVLIKESESGSKESYLSAHKFSNPTWVPNPNKDKKICNEKGICIAVDPAAPPLIPVDPMDLPLGDHACALVGQSCQFIEGDMNSKYSSNEMWKQVPLSYNYGPFVDCHTTTSGFIIELAKQEGKSLWRFRAVCQ